VVDIAECREIYEKARKQGQKEYNTRVSRGENGHLAVLGDRLGQCDVLAYVKQPLRDISVDRVAGTYTASRAQSFSAGFMPLHQLNSEFASKWTRLCCAHLNEGIRDPITVYEYLWRYYVVEGNKRVSVLKYYGAVSFSAEITRIIPRLDSDNLDTRRYHAFLEYARNGLFQELELSDPDRYERLYRQERRLLAELPEDEHPDFNRMYRFFEDCCHKAGCTMPVGDAFAEYLHIYCFPLHITADELQSRIVRLKPQLKLIENPEPPMLILDREQEETPLLRQIFSNRRRANLVFAYGPGRTADNWLGAHERGRLAMQEALGERVTSSCIDGLVQGNAYNILTERAADADVLFVTSSVLVNPALRFSLDHPECLTLLYSSARGDRLLPTYFGRYYEAVFLCGVAAGLYTRTGMTAYVTPKVLPPRYTSDINAFALGVRSVNRTARVILSTRGVEPYDNETCAGAIRELAQAGTDVVLTPLYNGLRTREGIPENIFSALFSLDRDGPADFLAAPGWNWEVFYTAIAESYLSGGLEVLKSYRRGDAAVTGFWWGLGSGVIDFKLPESDGLSEPGNVSGWAPPTTDNLLRYLRGSIRRGLYNPFHGPVTDQTGVLRIPPHTDPPPLEIMRMDWYEQSVELWE